ncbi:MAG: metalloregulator ArsR/SmtB family transcription factor [Rhodothermales bacterium]
MELDVINAPGPEADNRLSDAFSALGHPHRLTIMRRLLEHALSCCEADRPEDCTLDPTCCNFGDFVDELEINKATVSHHLKALEQAGLIERIREGRRVFVRANLDRLDSLRQFLDPHLHTVG